MALAKVATADEHEGAKARRTLRQVREGRATRGWGTSGGALLPGAARRWVGCGRRALRAVAVGRGNEFDLLDVGQDLGWDRVEGVGANGGRRRRGGGNTRTCRRSIRRPGCSILRALRTFV
ncbi:MAG: hypothetical protein D6705_17005 [Deltaproteobacteria bacterium]|nr:MAG: hypothetical protein D6705_17005 [Deltaproteobacteria bacterium]